MKKLKRHLRLRRLRRATLRAMRPTRCYAHPCGVVLVGPRPGRLGVLVGDLVARVKTRAIMWGMGG